MELIRITSAILRRKWLLIQAVLFFTVLSVVLTRNMPRQYKATTKVMVSTSDASMSVLSDMGLQELVSGMSDASDEMQNHIASSAISVPNGTAPDDLEPHMKKLRKRKMTKTRPG